jgi:hypothetical protein
MVAWNERKESECRRSAPPLSRAIDFCGFAVRRAAVIVTTSASHLASGVSLSVKGMPFFLVEAIPIGPHCVADRVLLVLARDPVFAWRIDCARNISHARSSIRGAASGPAVSVNGQLEARVYAPLDAASSSICMLGQLCDFS